MATTTAAHAVEVNEAMIWATRRGLDWWTLWRSRMEPIGRITVLKATIGGDVVAVACDSKEDAASLRDVMTGVGGIPPRAVKVRKDVA